MKEFTLEGEIGWTLGTWEVKNMLREAKGEDIKLNWASPGGSVITGIKIFNMIKKYSGKVDFHLIGEAASMGSYIPLAGNRITAEPNSVYMIHNARNWVGGDHNKMRKMADVVEGFSNILRNEYVRATGKTVEEITQMMDDETFLFGKEMIDAGFVDEIVGEADADPDAKNTHVALAREAFEACMGKLRNEKPDDYEEAAAVLTEYTAIKTDTVVETVDIKSPHASGGTKQELKMDLITLKANHPDLCEKLREEGVMAERDRAGAHLIYGAADLPKAIEAVKAGTPLTETLKAEYMMANANKDSLNAMADEDAETAAGTDNTADADDAETANAVLDEVKTLTGFEGGK